MKILIDTNVAITYISGRKDPFSQQIETVFRLCAEERVDGYLAVHSLSTIWYVSRKAPEKDRRAWLKKLCTIFTVSGADNPSILQAIDNTEFRDFEDALQDCCASVADVDYIVTVNKRDFDGHSTVPAVTPEEFIQLYHQNG